MTPQPNRGPSMLTSIMGALIPAALFLAIMALALIRQRFKHHL